MPDIFFSLDINGTLVYLNHEAERALHLDRTQCLGKNIWAIFPAQADSVYSRLYQQALVSSETVQLTIFADCLNRRVAVKLFPSPEGMLVYLAATKDQQEANCQFKQLAQVALHTSLSIIITDAWGATEWVNEGFTKHTGYTLADMLGKTPGTVLQGADTDPVTVRRCRERLAQQVPFSFTVLNYNKRGRKLWFFIDISPVHDETGQLIQYVAIQQDITFRKEAEASQATLKQKLYMQNQDLQQFTYAVANELQSPLATARALVTKIVQRDDSTQRALTFDETLAHLYHNITYADTALQDLSELLFLQDNALAAPQREPVALSTICGQAIASLADSLRQHGAQVELESEPNLTLRANKDYLYKVFYNLLANAIKCRSTERPLLITIKCYASASAVATISFTDNGLGFDRYKTGIDAFQLHKHFQSKQQTQGISLFLVKAYVDAMGGKIEVSSSSNVGTHFLLHLESN